MTLAQPESEQRLLIRVQYRDDLDLSVTLAEQIFDELSFLLFVLVYPQGISELAYIERRERSVARAVRRTEASKLFMDDGLDEHQLQATFRGAYDTIRFGRTVRVVEMHYASPLVLLAELVAGTTVVATIANQLLDITDKLVDLREKLRRPKKNAEGQEVAVVESTQEIVVRVILEVSPNQLTHDQRLRVARAASALEMIETIEVVEMDQPDRPALN